MSEPIFLNAKTMRVDFTAPPPQGDDMPALPPRRELQLEMQTTLTPAGEAVFRGLALGLSPTEALRLQQVRDRRQRHG